MYIYNIQIYILIVLAAAEFAGAGGADRFLGGACRKSAGSGVPGCARDQYRNIRGRSNPYGFNGLV